MRNKILFLCLFLFGTLTACKDKKWVDVPIYTPPNGTVTEEPDVPTNKELINCSYIRGDFYDLNRISAKSLATCNDLIYLAARPYKNGDLAFELPENTAKLVGGVVYEASKDGKNGVMHFDGTGLMNAGDGLLHSADDPCKQFTYGTYVYIENWVNGAYFFRKMNGSTPIIALQMGETVGDFKFIIGDYTGTATTALTVGRWHYIALSYGIRDGVQKAQLDIDNQQVQFSGFIPSEILNTRADFIVGENFKGYLEETMVFSIFAGKLGQSPIFYPTSTWNNTKVLAYWKYDESNNPGKDSHSWVTRLDEIRKDLNGQPGTRKLRLGITKGEWKSMVANETACLNFADEVKKVLEDYQLDGVDLDFEWPDNSTLNSNYSEAIVKIRERLGKSIFYTVSIHPSYVNNLSEDAYAATDFVSLQCYGPRKELYFLNKYKEAAEAAAQRIPKSKLILGVPFQGTTGNAGEQLGYYNFVIDNGVTDLTQDQITANGKTYYYNGVNTIREKTKYVCENGYAGIMSWDLAIDIDVTNTMSLLRSVNDVFELYNASSVE